MLKILFVITQGEMGGAQRYVLDLATQLANNPPLKIRGEEKGGYEIVVAVGREKSALKDLLEKKSVKVCELRHLVRNINPIKDVLAIFELKKLIKIWQPDIVHLNSGKAGFIGSIASRLAGNKNVIFTAHGFTFLEPNPWPLKFLYLWAEKIAKPFRKKIICVSEFDRQAALKYKVGKADQLITIHNGINIADKSARYKTVARPFMGSSATQPLTSLPRRQAGDLRPLIIIGTIAHLYPTKGLKYLIDAAHLLATSYKLPATFIIIGEGQERSYLESRIKNYGLEKNFKLLGEVKNAAQYLPQFDIFVLPSIKEGFPYTILEAMAAGLPIVATSVGGIPEMINPLDLSLNPSPSPGEGKSSLQEMERGGREVEKPSGILVPPKNPQALAEAIIFLLENPDLAKTLGTAARERVKEFSLEKMLQETSKVYQELLAL